MPSGPPAAPAPRRPPRGDRLTELSRRPTRYRTTLFDRYGPDARDIIRAWGFGLTVFGTSVAAFAFRFAMSIGTFAMSALFGVVAGGGSYLLGQLVGRASRRLMVDGSSTPYVEQYSQQQALVMQGKVEEALRSFEAIIAAAPDNVDARIKAAELYSRDLRDPARAAELFRQVQRIPGVAPGSDLYVSNRLVDLLVGPLADPGRAMVELRRLIERHPGTTAASHAREALARLKASHSSATRDR
jgi:tetratricopeptide (TPR) repeat protein